MSAHILFVGFGTCVVLGLVSAAAGAKELGYMLTGVALVLLWSGLASIKP